jgi:hypothetical protein
MLVNNKTNKRLNVANWLAPGNSARKRGLLMVETRNNLRSTSVRTYTFCTTWWPPRFLSIRGVRGLLALNQALI